MMCGIVGIQTYQRDEAKQSRTPMYLRKRPVVSSTIVTTPSGSCLSCTRCLSHPQCRSTKKKKRKKIDIHCESILNSLVARYVIGMAGDAPLVKGNDLCSGVRRIVGSMSSGGDAGLWRHILPQCCACPRGFG